MAPRLIVVLLASLFAGCATQVDRERTAWEVLPTLDVRHGMAEGKANFQMGRHHEMQGRTEMAEDYYRKAINADPRNADALNALARMYAEQGKMAQAEDFYRRLANLSPGRASLHNNIGYALSLQGRYKEAVDALRTAVMIDPAYERAWVNLERAASRGGMPELASLAARRTLPSPSADTLLASAVPDTPVVESPKTVGKIAESASTQALPSTVQPPVVPGDPAVTPVAVTQNLSAQPLPAAVQTVAEKLAEPAPVLAASSPTVMPSPAVVESVKVAPAGGGAKSVTRLSSAASVLPSQIKLTEIAPQPVVDSVRTAPLMPAPTATITKVSIKPMAIPERRESVTAQLTSVASPLAGRVEVSNGNGVERFAGRVSQQLRGAGFGVTRITNYDRYGVQRTIIEYQAGFGHVARLLRERLGLDAELKEVSVPRERSDVRVIVGWDAYSRMSEGVQAATPAIPRGHHVIKVES